MRFPPSFRNIAFGLALVGAAFAPAAAGTLPRLEADSLGGTHVVLPTDAAGKPLVLLLAFTKESQPDLKLWSKKFLDDHLSDRAGVYVVVVADKVAFGRKHVRQMVEGAAVGTQAQINSNVLITFNGDGWRQLTPPGDKKTAGIVVCDANGSVLFAKREPYTTENLAEVEKAAR
jgi:hypothetical protein